MSAPKRIQRKRTRGWRMPEGAAYVGRPSRWGNPFRIYHGHSLVGPSWSVVRESWVHVRADQAVYAYVTSSHPISVAEAVGQFRMLLDIRRRDEPDQLRRWLAPLRGRDLACWCPLDQPCHADVLLELANREEAQR
ncbi:DUF4326 domain-containing protein [Nocardia cyriacigeorgica]|uniref:DUF4326 domain-containing protein n=1 Tax=Nocardia cyriacigeorgica TaxID=135487 RepID=UPI002453A7E6|nr:DUF4326 domain-containing protein [Nocardia cyriacigeorgica]